MPEISILLPSLRHELVLQRITEFAETDQDVDYEIIVVSPFTVQGKRVIHVREEKQSGPIAAMNAAFLHSTAEFVAYWSDDASPTPHCLSNMLTFMRQNPSPFIAAFRLQDEMKRELEQWAIYGKLYACWGCVSKKSIEAVGGFFDPVYKSFWADPDLSTRTWAVGGEVALCPNAWVQIRQVEDGVKSGNLSKYFEDDTQTFFHKWHDRFGVGKPRVWTEINTAVPLTDRLYSGTKELPPKVSSIPADPRLKVLHIPLEFHAWQRARHWSYTAQLGIDEGFRANGVDLLTIPALCEFSSFELAQPEPAAWLKRLREICAGKTFDHIWIELVHTNIDEKLLQMLTELAPVRVAFLPESLEYTPEAYEFSPFLRERKALVEARLPFMTHVLTVDEKDAEDINRRSIAKAMWWPLSVPERFINAQDLPATGAPAFFCGALYGSRANWLEHSSLQGLLTKPRSLEDETHLPQMFDELNAASLAYLKRSGVINAFLVSTYLAPLRNIRQQAFKKWIETLGRGSAIVNLPSFFQGYASRVVEGMAAGRPVISWEVPDRPRTKALFKDGKEILLFSQDNPEELASHAGKVINDPDFARRIVAGARRKLWLFHTTEKRVQQVLQWIETGIEPSFEDKDEDYALDFQLRKYYSICNLT